MDISPEDVERIKAVSVAFQGWFNQMVKDNALIGPAIPEIVAHTWIRLRQHLPYEVAKHLLEDALAQAETMIREDRLHLEFDDGTAVAYMTAESYEGQEELRDMLAEASRGNYDLDNELRNLIEGE